MASNPCRVVPSSALGSSDNSSRIEKSSSSVTSGELRPFLTRLCAKICTHSGVELL